MARPRSFVVAMFAVLLALSASSVFAQHFQAVAGITLQDFSVGGTSVWGTREFQVYRYNAGTDSFDLIPGTIYRITAGGGNSFQPDDVWGIYNAMMYRFNYTTQTFVQIPGTMQTIVVGIGYDVCHPYEVWGLTPNRVIERYNYCKQDFDIIPGSLANLFTGGGEVWGYDAVNQAYRYNASSGSFDVFPGTLVTNIALGPDGVWAEDSGAQALQFNNSTQSFIGTGVTLFGIAAGGDGIWGFSSTGISRMIPSTGQLITIPMNEHAPRSILVGNGSGVWTTSYSQIVYRFVNP